MIEYQYNISLDETQFEHGLNWDIRFASDCSIPVHQLTHPSFIRKRVQAIILARHLRFEFVNKLLHLLFALKIVPQSALKQGFCRPKPDFECGSSNFDSPGLMFFEV